MKIFEKWDAIHSLVGGGITQVADGNIVYHDGQTPPSDEAIDAEVIKLQKAYDDLAYSRARQADYPDWGSQLNKIYDDGLTKWKSEMVDPVKAKWPKDNSGPV